MFDRFQPAQNVTVPLLDDMTHLIINRMRSGECRMRIAARPGAS